MWFLNLIPMWWNKWHMWVHSNLILFSTHSTPSVPSLLLWNHQFVIGYIIKLIVPLPANRKHIFLFSYLFSSFFQVLRLWFMTCRVEWQDRFAIIEIFYKVISRTVLLFPFPSLLNYGFDCKMGLLEPKVGIETRLDYDSVFFFFTQRNI